MTPRRMVSRTDGAILVLALAGVVASYAWLWRPAGGAGTEASLWVAGREEARLPLDQDQTRRVEGALGSSLIEVRDGRVRVAASPGPQQICVRAGWLQRSGESAICLPNQVVVEVEGGGPAPLDSVNF